MSKRITSKSEVRELIKEVRARVQSNNFHGRKDLAHYALGQENVENKSLFNTFHEVTVSALQGVKLGFEDADINATFDDSVLAMATKMGALAADPGKAMRAVYKPVNVNGLSEMVLPSQFGMEDVTTAETMSFEAFDGQISDNAITFSIVFNLAASQQDEFGEAFYPSITIDPLSAGANIETEFSSIMREVRHKADGTTGAADFNKRPVVKSLMDPSVFGVAKNRIYPAVNAENGDVVLDTIHSYIVDTGTETYSSAPLAINKNIGLIGVCQTPLSIAKGYADQTDSLDRRLVLDRVYFSVTGDADDGNGGTEVITEHFAIPVGQLVSANFTHNPQNHNKDMALAFRTKSIAFSISDTKLADGSDSRIFAQLAAGAAANHTFVVGLSLSGFANAQYGNVEVNKGNIQLINVRNANKDILPSTDPVYTAISNIVTDVDAFDVVGYTLEAYTTNSNLRRLGQLVTSDTYNYIYAVPMRTGVTVQTPTSNAMGDDNDAARLTNQITFAGAYMSMSAVQTLVGYADFLKSVTLNGVEMDITSGVGQFYVNSFYHEQDINLGDVIDSVKSKDRDADIRSGVYMIIRDVVMRMWKDSNYAVAFSKATLNSGVKATVVIGTDPQIARYIGDGKEFDFGPNLECKVVSTVNPIVAGKLYVTFGMYNSERNTTANPLNFGQMFHAPSIVTDTVRTIGNATYRELTTMPRFLHVTNLPVLAVFSISDFEGVLGKVTINTHAIV